MLEFGWRNVYSAENSEQERETGFLTQAKLRCGQRLCPDSRKQGMAVRLYGKVPVFLVRLHDILGF